MKNTASNLSPATRHLTAVLILAITGFGLYAHILKAPFVGDDIPNITDNPYIRMTVLEPAQIAQVQKSPSPRPLANFTFALNYYFQQYRPAGYHLCNIIIHILTAVLIFFLTGHTLRLCRINGFFPLSLFTALLWIAHPLHIQSVTYVVQRMNSLAAMFYISAFLFYIIFRMQVRASGRVLRFSAVFLLAAVLFSAFLAMISKPTAATLPIMLLLYEWFFFQDRNVSWLAKNRHWLYISTIAFILIAIIYLGPHPVATIMGLYQLQDFSLSQRLLTEPLVVIYYLSLLIFPHPNRLNFDYTFPVSSNLWQAPVIPLSLAAILSLFAASVYTAKTRRLCTFAALWYLITLTIESSVVGLAIIFEHRTYLPSIFPVIAFPVLLQKVLPQQATRFGVIFFLIGVSGFWTWQRNQAWQTNISLWQNCVAKSPRNENALNHLGLAYESRNNYRLAIRTLQNAINVNPLKTRNEHIQAIISYTSLGRLHFRQKRPEKALHDSHQALRICLAQFGLNNPQTAEIHSFIGRIQEYRDNDDQAWHHYQQSLSIRLALFGPTHIQTAQTCHTLGSLSRKKKNFSQASRYLHKALEIYKNHPQHNHPEITNIYKELSLIDNKQRDLQKTRNDSSPIQNSKITGILSPNK